MVLKRLHISFVLVMLLASVSRGGDLRTIGLRHQADEQLLSSDSSETLTLPAGGSQPLSVPAPSIIAEEREWQGHQCGVEVPSQLVFRDQRSFDQFWSRLIAPHNKRYKTPPAVDFSQDMVVAVFAGKRSFPESGIQIVGMDTKPAAGGTEMKVRYEPRSELGGLFTRPNAVRPFHVKRVPIFRGSIVFEPKSPHGATAYLH